MQGVSVFRRQNRLKYGILVLSKDVPALRKQPGVELTLLGALTMDSVSHKTCRVCGQDKPLTEYPKNNKKDGYRSACKKCQNKYLRNWEKSGASEGYKAARTEDDVLFNQGLRRCTKCEAVKPLTLEYFHAHSTENRGFQLWCKDCKNNHRRNFYQENKERIKEQCADYQKRNPEIYKEAARKYRRTHRTAVLVSLRLRYTRKKGAGGAHTADDIELQYRSQKGRCWHCGKVVGDKYHVDHLIPITRNGSNNPNNLVISCAYCNISKGNKLTQEWNGKLF